jgi:hypothetical protein
MVTLPSDTPTAVMFLDESGAVARDRFFAVGCLKLAESAQLLRDVNRLRDHWHWYKEIHFKDLTHGALEFYKEVVNLLADSAARFSLFRVRSKQC